MRPRKFRIVIYPITDDSPLVEWTYYLYAFLKNYLILSYVVIAVNRLTVFFFETNYKKFWSDTVIYCITFGAYLLLIILRLMSYNSGYMFRTNVDTVADLFMFTVPLPMDLFDSGVDISLSIGSGIICTVLYLLTACKAHRSTISGNRKKREMIILRSAVLTFLLMVPSAIRGTIQCYAIIKNDQEIKTISNRTATYFVEILFVSEPWILVLTFHSIRQRIALVVGSAVFSGSNIENSSSNIQTITRHPIFHTR